MSDKVKYYMPSEDEMIPVEFPISIKLTDLTVTKEDRISRAQRVSKILLKNHTSN